MQTPYWVWRTIPTAKMRELRFRRAQQFVPNLSATGDRARDDPGQSDPKACLNLYTALLPVRDDASTTLGPAPGQNKPHQQHPHQWLLLGGTLFFNVGEKPSARRAAWASYPTLCARDQTKPKSFPSFQAPKSTCAPA